MTDESNLTAEDIRKALEDVMNPPPLKPVCWCGSISAYWIDAKAFRLAGSVRTFDSDKRGFYCTNGHYLPGQDMP